MKEAPGGALKHVGLGFTLLATMSRNERSPEWGIKTVIRVLPEIELSGRNERSPEWGIKTSFVALRIICTASVEMKEARGPRFRIRGFLFFVSFCWKFSVL